MNISTLTAHHSSLFEIDAELEAAFDQLRELAGFGFLLVPS
jgi:hypothetical protein